MIGIDGGQAVEVNIGDCRCPGDPRPHPDGDVVWMKPKVDVDLGAAASSALYQASNWLGDNMAALFSVYVRHGIVGWNIVDKTGPVRATPDAILDRLGWLEGGQIVALKGQELYYEGIFGSPLAIPSVVSPPDTHSNGSTSRKTDSGRRTRSSSRRSLPSGRVAGK